jgi:hypothetical protein
MIRQGNQNEATSLQVDLKAQVKNTASLKHLYNEDMSAQLAFDSQNIPILLTRAKMSIRVLLL